MIAAETACHPGSQLRHFARRPRLLQPGPRVLLLLMAAVALLTSGCWSVQLNSDYGSPDGPSVNGVKVLMKLFERRGFRVSSRRMVGQSVMRDASVIVWTPRNLPSEDDIEWVEQWLRHERGRVFVYVGPDYDAAPLYWERMLSLAPLDQQGLLREKWREARTLEQMYLGSLADELPTEWFYFRKPLPWPSPAATLGQPIQGTRRFVDGIAASRLELRMFARMDPPPEADVLLAVDNQPVISRTAVLADAGGLSHRLMVTNASFLFNMPLVNPEQRRLTLRMIDEISELVADHSPNRQLNDPYEAVFLRGHQLAPHWPSQNPPSPEHNMYAMFQEPPLSYVLLQFAILAVVYVFAGWPIAGRPRTLATRSISDFGRHIEAYGRLLEGTRQSSHAVERLADYRAHVRDKERPSGHVESPGRHGGDKPP